MSKNNKSTLSKKKLMHGGFSVIVSVLLIAVIILLNAVLYSLAQKHPMSFKMDITEEGIYTISDEAKEFVKEYIEAEGAEYTIYFCKEKDQIDSDGDLVVMVRDFIEIFAAQYDNVHVEYVDIFKNPSFAKYYTDQSQVELLTSHIIVQSKTGQFRQLAPAAFFTTAQSTGEVYSFKGEITLTNAIIQVSGDDAPAVTFTIGHNESTNAALASTLYDAGFQIQYVDLATGEIPENTRMLIISNPTKDFAGIDAAMAGGTNEIQKIADYLLKKNHLIVMVNPDTPDLPELRELLSEWGLDYMVGTRLYDFTNSLGNKGLALNAKYYAGTGAEDDPYLSSAAYKMHSSVSTLNIPVKTILNNAVPLIINKDVQRDVYPSLTTYETALAFKSDMTVDNKDDSINQALGSGEYPIMAVSTDLEYVGEAGAQALHHTTVVLIGSTDFGADAYVGSGAYGNKEIFYQMARLMGSQKVPSGLDWKKFETQALSITAGEARTWTVIIAVIVPLIASGVGFAVWSKRRHL